MPFEPTKVIEMNRGKQIGQTSIQDAENIPYGSTNVKDALDQINTDLSDLYKWNSGFNANANEYLVYASLNNGLLHGSVVVPKDVLTSSNQRIDIFGGSSEVGISAYLNASTSGFALAFATISGTNVLNTSNITVYSR